MSSSSGVQRVTQEPVDRAGVRQTFLAGAGWGEAKIHPLAGDASTRSYYRIEAESRRAVLMDAPPAAESAPCPPDADEAERRALGYNAMARLAGPDSRAFAVISDWLYGMGLSAPKVLASDYEMGFLLLEDLGDDLFAHVMAEGTDPRPLYEAAIDVLLHLHRREVPSRMASSGADHPILSYDQTALTAEIDLLLDWYLPAISGVSVPDEVRADLHRCWVTAWSVLTPMRPVLVLRDYHAENLLWLPERDGTARAGLIDFQDALAGHPAYDLVSLLTDARRDVEPYLASDMLERYLAVRRSEPDFDETAFRTAYALLSIQRNAKILGIFARLWKRDGKPKYLSFLPRVWRYLEADLANPALGSLQDWFEIHIPAYDRGDRLQKIHGNDKATQR